MLLTLILCGLFYLYSYVSLNLQTSDNLLYIHLLNAFPTYGRHTLGFALRATVYDTATSLPIHDFASQTS